MLLGLPSANNECVTRGLPLRFINAESKNAFDYRSRVSDSESASIWQSLSFGANYKAAYRLSICSAGEDVIAPYLADKKAHLNEVVKSLNEKEETVYVLENSDAEDHVAKRFPNKTTKHVGNSLRPISVKVGVESLGLDDVIDSFTSSQMFDGRMIGEFHASLLFVYASTCQKKRTQSVWVSDFSRPMACPSSSTISSPRIFLACCWACFHAGAAFSTSRRP